MKKEFFIHNGYIEGNLIKDGELISWCKINIQKDVWTISDWKTVKEYQHNGFGKKCLQFTLEKMKDNYPLPKRVEYIWNGQNQYVYNWLLKNFDPVSQCPIAVQKYSCADDWDSHIYNLNTDKFFNYFFKST